MSLPAASAGWSVPRRWVVAAAATFGMLASFGMATTVSVFIKPFEDEFGWLRADISFAYALFSAGAALGGLVVGWAFDRIDTRIIVVFGTIVEQGGITAAPGLYVLGLRWLRRRSSSFITGTGRDAHELAREVASFVGRRQMKVA